MQPKTEFPSTSPSRSPLIRNRNVALLIVLVLLIVVDISLIRIHDTVNKRLIPIFLKEVLFGAISFANILIQILLLRSIKPVGAVTKGKVNSRLGLIHAITSVGLYFVWAAVIFICVQTILVSVYTTLLLLLVTIGSYLIGLGILISFIIRIMDWITFRTSSWLLVLLVLVLGCVSINATIGMIDASLRLDDRPPQTRATFGGSMDISKGKLDFLDDLYFYTYILSFAVAWIAGSALMKFYSSKIGKVKYWVIASCPMIFFLMQFAPLLTQLFLPSANVDQFFVAAWVTAILTLSKPFGGLLIGIQFWITARALTQQNPISMHLIIAGFGFLLLFTANQAILLSIAPYPPFGLSTITTMGLAAYLLVLGTYTSTISLSNDSELRKTIKQYANSHTNLMNSLASAEVEREVSNRVREIIKKQSADLERVAGIQSSLSEQQARDYLKEVLDELKTKRPRSDDPRQV